MRKSWLRNYTGFSRKSRTGIVALIALILLLTMVPLLLPLLQPPQPHPAGSLSQEMAALERFNPDTTVRHPRKYPAKHPASWPPDRPALSPVLFPFDPNQVSDSGWQRLGLREKTIRTIRNYLSKGGRFRTATDIRKIWGLRPEEAERLIPYVRISPPAAAPPPAATRPEPLSRTPPPPLDINLADTAAWIALPGIGSKLAARIVAFREKLGGFCRVEQVGETYGLADSVFRRLLPRLSTGEIHLRKINLNRAGLDELKAHPYIRYPLARAILQYREQHGPFAAPEALRDLAVVSDEIYRKLLPYLATD